MVNAVEFQIGQFKVSVPPGVSAFQGHGETRGRENQTHIAADIALVDFGAEACACERGVVVIGGANREADAVLGRGAKLFICDREVEIAIFAGCVSPVGKAKSDTAKRAAACGPWLTPLNFRLVNSK